ncbi:phosphopantetheine-binding protein [Pseudomonas sp. KNUC1026]|uniref:phosphopantetheine-binding protein n=1 Tax=Pseudomonas sp. KNUC1026 TaxID=2893890 RepID=UPI003FA6E509
MVAHDGPAGKALFAYLVPADASLLQQPEQAQAKVFRQLRAQLAEALPEYMLPSGFTALQSLPHTPNGKLDRRALPAPTRLASAHAYQAPQTDTEKRVAQIWQEVLKLERVGLGDHFFELGGHSLLATQVTSRLQAEFGADVPLSALFQATSLGHYLELMTPYLKQAAESDFDELSDFLSELETL